MTTLNIITNPNEILRKHSKELERNFVLHSNTQKLIRDMTAAMYEDDGIGLAAPQIGKNIRLVIIGKEANSEKKDLALINPVWQKLSRKKAMDTEGCLSLPKTFGQVKRYKKIQVEAMNEHGKHVSFEASDLLARVIQHEVDHLDGILFIDKAKNIYTAE